MVDLISWHSLSMSKAHWQLTAFPPLLRQDEKALCSMGQSPTYSSGWLFSASTCWTSSELLLPEPKSPTMPWPTTCPMALPVAMEAYARKPVREWMDQGRVNKKRDPYDVAQKATSARWHGSGSL